MKNYRDSKVGMSDAVNVRVGVFDGGAGDFSAW